MNILLTPITKTICLYKFLGYHRAELNWQFCIDPDTQLRETIKKRKLVLKTEKRIAIFMENLRITLSDDEFAQLSIECDSFELQSRNTREREIECQYRPSDVVFNKNAVHNMTNVEIPEDILIGLSFGYKFLFPYACTKHRMCEILAQLDLTITQAIPDLKQLETTMDISRILRNESRIQNDNNKIWLSFIHLRAKQFFLENKNFFATRTDKGGHTVILTLQQYNTRLSEMLESNSYQQISYNPLEMLVKKEKRFIQTFKKDPSLTSVA